MDDAKAIKEILGLKKDADKPRWDLLPFKELEEVVDILTFGAKKYKPNNWKYVRPAGRYVSAAFRHLTAWIEGERKDPESGKSHLAHVICNILFLMWFDNHGLVDNIEEEWKEDVKNDALERQ